MKLNLLRTCMLTLLFGSGFLLYAFTPIELNPVTSFLDYSDCATSLSNTISVETVVRVPEGESGNLHDFDKLALTNTTEIYQVNRCVTNNNEVNTERILISSDAPVQDWVPQVTRTVSNEEGIRLYDANSNLLTSLPTSDKAQAQRTALSNVVAQASSRTEDAAAFPLKVSTSEINTKIAASTDSKNLTQLANGDLLISSKTAVEGTNRENVQVMEFQSLGNEQYVPVRIQERRYEVSAFSGVCIEFVETTSFADYNVNGRAINTRSETER